MRALIAGSSGLVGRACLETLLHHPAYARVTAYGRRPLGITHPRLVARIVALDGMDAEPPEPADHAFCALGTTIKTAGSQEAFRRVDLLMVSSFAAYARRSGVATLVLVSSVGANALSSNFYLRTKGEAEDAVARLGFERLRILRPGLLLGARADRRAGERAAQRVMPWLSSILVGPLRAYGSIAGRTVGTGMVGTALAGEMGTVVLRNDDIEAAAHAAGTEAV